MNVYLVKTGSILPLGKQGENLARKIQFDLSRWISTFGPGTVQLLHQRNGDEAPYPVAVEKDGTQAIWTVTNADTAAAGTGRAELQYYVGDALAKSETWMTKVLPALGPASETPPEAQQGWVDQVLQAGTAAAEAADRAEEAAVRQPYPNEETGTWWVWDAESGAYADTGISYGTGAGGGVTDHDKLTGRDKTDQHPMSAITGLADALAGKQPTGAYLTEETDPTVPAWAKAAAKPGYTASEVGADPSGTAAAQVSAHNTEATAHSDIRLLIQGLTDRLNALADSDDTTLDQLSEIVAYIKSNRDLISAVTTDKVSAADIVNDLVTNVANKPLSAAQGVALKTLIDSLSEEKVSLPVTLADISESDYVKADKNPDILADDSEHVEYVNSPIWTTTFKSATYTSSNAENPYVARRVRVKPGQQYVLYRNAFIQPYVNGGIVFFEDIASNAPLYGIFSWTNIKYNDGTNAGVDTSDTVTAPYIVTPTDGTAKYIVFTVPEGCTALQINMSKAEDMSYIPQICEGTVPDPLFEYAGGYSEVYKLDGCNLADTRLRKRRPFKSYKWGVLGDSISTTPSSGKYYQVICDAEDWTYQCQAGSGHTVSYVSGQVGMLEDDVDFITLFIGTNDWENYADKIGDPTDTTDSFCYAFKNAISIIKTAFPLIPLLVITPIPRYDDETANESVRKIADAEQAVCEYCSIPCVNMFTSSGLYNNTDLIGELYSDGLHPNVKGHLWITPPIREAIKRMMM